MVVVMVMMAAMTVKAAAMTVKAAALLKMATMAKLAETVAAVMSMAEKAVADITDGKAADGISERTLVHK
jgi:hypothetical protein